jgi:Domain of unknown function (DUF4168)
MRQTTRVVAGLAISVAWSFGTHGISVQAQSPSPPSLPQSSSDVAEQKLDKGTAALERISSLRHDYLDEIGAAPPAEHDRIVGKARREFTKAITDQGLSLDEYAEFIEAAKNDPQIHEKVFQRFRRLRNRKIDDRFGD